ncbi:hypothetical protein [Pandoravirus japonicus]|uniref:YspA cpYpsA-related SLOG domain-containing protein n=1 Tax=Pandoravirus japonicus TaxID=2823154 RepID=A0A811BQC2_9VIRU|nr:hypothetical protein [Pandoravirus japonicus]
MPLWEIRTRRNAKLVWEQFPLPGLFVAGALRMAPRRKKTGKTHKNQKACTSQGALADKRIRKSREKDMGDTEGAKSQAPGSAATVASAKSRATPPLRVAVVGGRDFGAYDVLERCLDALAEERGAITTIVSGGARGADAMAADYARRRGIVLIEFRPDYAACRTPRERRRAPLLRNADIIAGADIVVAFWDGRSRGTADSIARARRAGIARRIYDYAGRARSPQTTAPAASRRITPWTLAAAAASGPPSG